MKLITRNIKTKMRLVISILLVLSVGAAITLLPHDRIDTTYYKIYSTKINQGIKIVQLTDLHSYEFGEENVDLIEKIKNLQPDLIVITGDMMNYRNNDYSVVVSLCTTLVEVAPVYYSFGNHEYDQFLFEDKGIKEELEGTGIHLLNDQIETTTINGNRLSICGLSQNVEQYDKYGVKLIDEFEQTEGLRILLDHYPEHYYEKLVAKDIDVTFSGHAHGGQIRLPGNHGLYAPNQGFFPDLTEGLHTYEHTNLIISRGLGDHTIIPRINNNPEIVVTYLAPQKANR